MTTGKTRDKTGERGKSQDLCGFTWYTVVFIDKTNEKKREILLETNLKLNNSALARVFSTLSADWQKSDDLNLNHNIKFYSLR